MSELTDKAEQFAINAHEAIGQRRKYVDLPYYVHPQAVAKMVKDVGGDDAMIASAFLHDVVEDTGVSLQTIIEEFGSDVGELVESLTDVSKLTDGNRKIRKTIDLNHTARASPRAKTVKLADLIHNTKSIVAFDPGFAWKYLEEKEALLEVLTEGNPVLYELATTILKLSKKVLKEKQDESVVSD